MSVSETKSFSRKRYLTNWNNHNSGLFAKARVVEVISRSEEQRDVEPFCPYFSMCGGCQYQVSRRIYLLVETFLIISSLFADDVVRATIED